MWTSLRSGGKLCANIVDVNVRGSQGNKKKSWILKICDPMSEFIDEFRDSKKII